MFLPFTFSLSSTLYLKLMHVKIYSYFTSQYKNQMNFISPERANHKRERKNNEKGKCTYFNSKGKM